jgi:para-nitrobenzyl esterase
MELSISNRRTFLKQVPLMIAGTRFIGAAESEVIAESASGKLRGVDFDGIKVFKGIPYGASTEGKNRFMPPVKPAPWTSVRDALEFGHSSPQNGQPAAGAPAMGEDCLVLNVFTPGLGGRGTRPVMVWLHGGGFATGSGSGRIYDGKNLARTGDVVVVSINHRLNVFGATYLGEALGSEFARSGSVGIQDIVAALQWVRENVAQFGGDPNQVTIFGQSGGGRKVATLMSMPDAKGLFHRAIIESGAVLRLTTKEDAIRYTNQLLIELGMQGSKPRDLQAVPAAALLAANNAVLRKIKMPEPGMVANSPMVDGRVIPGHPWDPTAPTLSANIPLLAGYARTEETFYDRPTPESMAMTEAVLKERAAKRLGSDPTAVIETYRKAHPDATPWDLHILIATDHPRGAHSRELAKRKAQLGQAPVYFYRFDWETPESGGHMRSPHTIDVPFVFNNVKIAGPKIGQMPEAQVLADKVSAAWAAFARTGNPNVPGLPKWPAYSDRTRDTMLFNNVSRVVQDPDREPRLIMEKILKLS